VESAFGRHNTCMCTQNCTRVRSRSSAKSHYVMPHSQSIINCESTSVLHTLLLAQSHTDANIVDVRSLLPPIRSCAHMPKPTMVGSPNIACECDEVNLVHNTDKRYTCAHESCTSITTGATLPAYFPTWSALQHHMRTAHPPTCPHASCNGKTFTAQSGLRAHLKIHAERELEAQFNTAVVDTADEDDDRPRKRRRGGEVGRDWVCEETACGKDFKSKKALVTHQKVSHLGRRDFICSHSNCQRAFGYKHLLQRHVAKVHHSNTFSGPESGPSDTSEGEHSETDPGEPSMFSIASITGDAYTTRSRAQLSTTKTLQCPYPYLPVLLTGEAPDAVDSPSTSPHHTSQCQYVFSRAYDLRRHMHAEHDLHFEKEAVEKWVRTAKQAKVDASSGI